MLNRRGIRQRPYTQMPRSDWHHVRLGPDDDMDRTPDYGPYRLTGGMNSPNLHGDTGRGYERDDDPRYGQRGYQDDLDWDMERAERWRVERQNRWQDDRDDYYDTSYRDWNDQRSRHDRDDYDRGSFSRGDYRPASYSRRDEDRDWRGYEGGDYGREANRPYERNYGRGYDREFGRGYERGLGYDYGRHAGSQAREGYTRPGVYDASFERGAYRDTDYDDRNDRRNTWGSRTYGSESIGRGWDYDRDFERGRGDFSSGEGRPYAGSRGLETGQREDLYGSGTGPYVGRGPKGYSRSPERIHEDVCERLTHHGRIDATHIDIRVDGDEVTLEGEVDSRSAKRLAESLAEEVRGVRDVHNRLKVNRDLRHSDRASHEVTGLTGHTAGMGGASGMASGTTTGNADIAPTAVAEPKQEITLTETRSTQHREPQKSNTARSDQASGSSRTESREST